MEDFERIYEKAIQLIILAGKIFLSELIASETTSIHSGAALGLLYSCWMRVSRIRSNLETKERQSQFPADSI
jgi:hypothetical protein